MNSTFIARKLYDTRVKTRLSIPNMEALLDHLSTETTKTTKEPYWIPKLIHNRRTENWIYQSEHAGLQFHIHRKNWSFTVSKNSRFSHYNIKFPLKNCQHSRLQRVGLAGWSNISVMKPKWRKQKKTFRNVANSEEAIFKSIKQMKWKIRSF